MTDLRTKVIKLAASYPQGSAERRALLHVVAGLEQDLDREMSRLISDYENLVSSGAEWRAIYDRGKAFKEWFLSQFRIGLRTTPRGGKQLKQDADAFLWVAANAPSTRKPAENGIAELKERWAEFRPKVPELVRLFSDEGGKTILKEIKTPIGTYYNDRGVATATFKRYVKSLDQLFGSLRGWRRKALVGGLTVRLAGPDQFRGTAAGRYNAPSDTMFIRATPKIMKRTPGTYASPDYIIIHELGHRYENKVGVSTDFQRREWYTTRYSQTEGMSGSSEAFAELFALGHFGMTRVRDDFTEVIERFERIMP